MHQRALLKLFRQGSAERRTRKHWVQQVADHHREHCWYTQELGLTPDYLLGSLSFGFSRAAGKGWSVHRRCGGQVFRKMLRRKTRRDRLVTQTQALGARQAYRRR